MGNTLQNLRKNLRQRWKRLGGFQRWAGALFLVLVLFAFQFTRGLFFWGFVLAGVIWFFWGFIREADDQNRDFFFRFLIPVLFIVPLCIFLLSFAGGGGAIAVGLVIGIILAIWLTPIVCKHLGTMFTNTIFGFGGGTGKVEKVFRSSVAEGYRKRGMFQEALTDINEQLEELVDNFEGNLLKAEIYAEDLKDYAGAESVIKTMLAFEELNPKLVVMLYNRLADWQIKLRKDLDGAKAMLQQIVDRYPNSEEALYALQRMNRLRLPNEGAPTVKKVVRIVEDLGLKKGFQGWEMPEVSWKQEMEETIAYLTEHPQDWDARERLAIIYQRECKDIEKAISQLEILVKLDGQPRKKVAQWLNMEADFYVQDYDYNNAKATLERIVELYPDSGPANLARNRIVLLKKEIERGCVDTFDVPETDPSLAAQNAKRVVRTARRVGAQPTIPLETSASEAGSATPEFEISAGEEIRKLELILEQNPQDYDANERIAALYANNMGEVELGISYLENLINKPNQPAGKINHWLNMEADFYLHAEQLSEEARVAAAKKALVRVEQLIPNTPCVPKAQRRILYLRVELSKAMAPKYQLKEAEDQNVSESRIPKVVRDTWEKQGIEPPASVVKKAPPTPPEAAPVSPVPVPEEDQYSWVQEMATLESELIIHPDNIEAREQLATIYAFKSGETEVAITQMEVLLGRLDKTPRQTAQWLHREADFYIHDAILSEDERLSHARNALNRIAELLPGHPLVRIAANRIARLKTELTRDPAKIYPVPESPSDRGLLDKEARVPKVIRENRKIRSEA